MFHDEMDYLNPCSKSLGSLPMASDALDFEHLHVSSSFQKDNALKVQTKESQRRSCLGSRMDLPYTSHGSLCTHT
jgi:hypothetical protein